MHLGPFTIVIPIPLQWDANRELLRLFTEQPYNSLWINRQDKEFYPLFSSYEVVGRCSDFCMRKQFANL